MQGISWVPDSHSLEILKEGEKGNREEEIVINEQDLQAAGASRIPSGSNGQAQTREMQETLKIWQNKKNTTNK